MKERDEEMNRSAIVTGSGRGIGLAIALRLAEDGHRVVVNDLDPEAVESAIQVIHENGGKAIGVVSDVSTKEGAENLIEVAIKNYNAVDIIVNNAGIARPALLHQMKVEQLHDVFRVVAFSPFYVLMAAAPYMRDVAKNEIEKFGAVAYHRKVISISSIAGITGMAANSNYSAAKAAVIGMTKALAQEWAAYGINVNAIAPGFVEGTGLTKPPNMPESLTKKLFKQIPLQRFALPKEIAAAVSFLASDQSDYITGQVLTVAGGTEVLQVLGPA
jgi:3-oxoacyl-[acyl-carrier protein] reductase